MEGLERGGEATVQGALQNLQEAVLEVREALQRKNFALDQEFLLQQQEAKDGEQK